jgi:O-antigen/teichoic acid export membrane protein
MQLPNRHSGVVQSVGYATANVAGSLFSAISLIILSRGLGPASFGAFSVAFSLTSVAARIADLGLSVPLQKFIAASYRDNPDQVAAAFSWGLRIKFMAAAIAILFGIMFGPWIGTTVFGLSDPRFASLGIIMASIIIMYEYAGLINQSIHQFRAAAWINAIQAMLKFGFGIVILLVAVPSAYQSYIWYGLFPLFSVIYGFSKIPARFKQNLPAPMALKQQFIKTAKFTYIAALAITVADQVDILMVKSMLDEYQTGLYAVASRISLMFTLFAMSVGTVLNTRVARYKQKDLTSFYKKCLMASLALILSTPFLVMFAKLLLLVSAGSAYLDALPATRLLLISTTITMATIPLIAPFFSLDYPRYFMFAGLLQIIILVTGNYVLIPILGIEGSAWAKIIMRVVVLFYTLFISYKLVKAHHEVS